MKKLDVMIFGAMCDWVLAHKHKPKITRKKMRKQRRQMERRLGCCWNECYEELTVPMDAL